ncbi:acetyl-CoA carboxylase biotin carboxylase subunit [Lactiplantibacillus mudanjiangensis]|uniref:biotin carboxylase n=1 Tax=Lactiplantibacillus mudanjiangensis TaxID=1296538 RepID=A0A660E3F5_9LACO|nr:acetyl-CoA carboxylase biotin carboxylase subunit [Lactiplantibacillus mudanjiangensis]VDG24179.1 acetyl-CoA carboxylase biotin carboxylase subunit [Lactobacillus pentosus] [Lactiplantibacillus mudanjiangensis]VDG30160.1 acetyl-CoA carboxylase biotin carboxylase subunit [Lactobacillus pentosus] [Lactiplantibacillus mudanjiangensis]
MFTKVLIANRGEIAVQIIRALHELAIQAVAVYSVADQDSPFVQLADEAICIGAGPAVDSYLNMQAIISAANLTGCQAIHPGYGFLSENATFAALCAECQLTFIGPDPAVIEKMGDKAVARQTMQALGMPVIPGSVGILDTASAAVTAAKQLGYPVMIKAAAGGGGKGIRAVNNDHELMIAFETAQQEAQVSYGDDRLYLEKIITAAKHIEVQVIADQHGTSVYLPERDCSLQRQHQKVIEESPCQALTTSERQQLGELVASTTKKLHYTNTGTFEFLMSPDHQFYFLEMNTRLQVEHTVTEMVTGVELIKAQVIVAAGEPLPFTQADIKIQGVAIEARLNAEDPAQQFRPQPGRIDQLLYPVGTLGVRIDAGVVAGSTISPFYDSMIAKVIVHSRHRATAIRKLQRCLTELSITGVKTNRHFLTALLDTTAVQTGETTTTYIEKSFLKGWLTDAQTKISSAN